MLFTSCVSYKVMPKELRNVDAKLSPEKAYVINKDEFEKEYKILNDSKIFELSDDASTPLKIKLGSLTEDEGRLVVGKFNFSDCFYLSDNCPSISMKELFLVLKKSGILTQPNANSI